MVFKKGLYIHFIIFLLYFFLKTYSIDIIISDENNLYNLPKKIDSLSQSSINDQINIILENDYYKLPSNGNSNYNIKNTVIFYSEKGTIFDFQQKYQTRLTLFLYNTSKFNKIVFQNITFINYTAIINNTWTIFLELFPENGAYQVEFNNCSFLNIKGLLLNVYHLKIEQETTYPQIIFNNLI
ncbi:hypothetical protein U3516DRAFT_27834 [Neocallimastix sp. 'constans']